MKFSYEWIKELSGTTLSAEDASAVLTAKAFEVKESGPVLDIDILPNRPDAVSHLGVARELCALSGQRFAAPVYEYAVSERPDVEIEIRDAAACMRYSALIVRGVTVGPSPAWLRERLEACGLQSINNVVDVTNYVMLELGQPMHAFDRALIDRIVVRRAETGETLQALDEARTSYALDNSMLVIADGTRPLAIAGIKGGVGTGITDATTDVLLEAAAFGPESVRATSRALNLRTDASIRFGYGVDPNLTAPALVRAGELLAKAAGGTPDSSIIDVYPSPASDRVLSLDPEYVRALLGIAIPNAQIRSILESLSFEVTEHEGSMNVRVPTRRLDVVGQEDLVEEVGRVYGYDAIPAAAPVLPIYDQHSWVQEDTAVAWDEASFIRERAALVRLLAGAGYAEVYNYVFLSDELRTLLKLEHLHELAQPQSGEYRWLRSSLVPRLLVNARDNLRFAERVRLFETGHTFSRIGEGKEDVRVGIVLASRAGGDELFYELKGVVALLLERLGITGTYSDDAAPFPWDASAVHATLGGRQALVRADDDTVLGFIGAVHPRIASALKLKGYAAIAELDLRALVRFAQEEREFAPLPKYPSVVRDIALFVDQGVKIDDIIQTIHGADPSDLVDDVDVFDIFVPTGTEKLKAEGDTPEYGKSVAFHLVFRSDERTLTDAEVDAAEVVIKQALQEKLNARVR
ncbi:MAG: phenylalanine--tRNA ligase subunit beta [Candidatus Yanofskybacteria bacterium]|nr:phenylalanine--tRNA ligase subunit beta [Candidatus Yanofskybacteria bacterium]